MGFEFGFSAHFIYVFLRSCDCLRNLCHLLIVVIRSFPTALNMCVEILTPQEHYYYMSVLALCGLYGPARVLEYKYIYFALTAHNKPYMHLMSI